MKDGKLEATHRALAKYRSTRKNRKTPIPDNIREKILSHLGQYSVPELSDRLGLADCLIYKWKKAKNAGPHKGKFPQTGPFVELPLDATAFAAFEGEPSTSVVEFSRTDGAIMRIPVNLKRENLNILITNFFGGLSPCSV